MHNRLWIIVTAWILLASSVLADIPHKGIGLGIPLITKDPQYLRAYQISAWYQPPTWEWKHIRIYLNAAAGHWWVTNTSLHHSLNIYSVSPILRYYFIKDGRPSVFLNVGIGPSYLSRTHLDGRNLGMHFAFQDQLGVGATFGKKQQFTAIFSALHYSNGSLCSMNAGITVPVMLNLEYGFA